MQATDSSPELSQLLSLHSPRFITIDGAHGSGKSTLAKTLSQFLNAKLVEADKFLRKHQDSYLPSLDYASIRREIDPERLCILDGVCMRELVATARLAPDIYVYVKRMARWGWADEDDLVFEGAVEDHLERLKLTAASFFDEGEEPRLGLWEEVIRYHAVHRPHETSDFVFLRRDA